MAIALQRAEAAGMVATFEESMDEEPASLIHDAIYFPSQNVEDKAEKYRIY